MKRVALNIVLALATLVAVTPLRAQQTQGTLQMAGNRWPAAASAYSFSVTNLPVLMSVPGEPYSNEIYLNMIAKNGVVTVSVIGLDGIVSPAVVTSSTFNPTATSGTLSLTFTTTANLSSDSLVDDVATFTVPLITWTITRPCPRCNPQTQITSFRDGTYAFLH